MEARHKAKSCNVEDSICRAIFFEASSLKNLRASIKRRNNTHTNRRRKFFSLQEEREGHRGDTHSKGKESPNPKKISMSKTSPLISRLLLVFAH